MKTISILSAACLLAAVLSGCVTPPQGLVYSHTITPLDLNHDRTQNVKKTGKSDIKHFRYYVDVRWDSNAIGDIARREGMKEVYYADIEVLNVLGIWHQYTVHVYGE